jgi:hypothetical protein
VPLAINREGREGKLFSENFVCHDLALRRFRDAAMNSLNVLLRTTQLSAAWQEAVVESNLVPTALIAHSFAVNNSDG